MKEKALIRYKELTEKAIIIQNSKYQTDSGLYGFVTRVDNDLFTTWKVQVKSFIIKYFGKDSMFYEGFEKIENSKGNISNKPIFEKMFSFFKAMEDELEEIEITNEAVIENKKLKNQTNKIFIVHGHDGEAKIEIARFIEKLGFEPIILHEQASSNSTIIEKIEDYIDEVSFGIVLYTECDVGGKDVDNLSPRARQNVVFEHGYLIGNLGRENVCSLVKGNVETPGDLGGIVYMKMNDDSWHVSLAKELKKAGYKIDFNKIL